MAFEWRFNTPSVPVPMANANTVQGQPVQPQFVQSQPQQDPVYTPFANANAIRPEVIDRQNEIADIDRQIDANNAKIAELKQQLSQLKGTTDLDAFDRAMAANRANIGDFANAQQHLGRIENRRTARLQNENALKLKMADKVGSQQELDDLVNLAKIRTTLEAVSKDSGLRSGYEREYNIRVKQYTDKYGHSPDFSQFEGKVDLFSDRSGQVDASIDAMAQDKDVLNNVIESNTDTSGHWTGSDERLDEAIKAAEKAGDQALAKKLKNTWTVTQFNKMRKDMKAEGKKQYGHLTPSQKVIADKKGSFTDKSGRTWKITNGEWTSVNYKWNGKKNGVK